jgi:uncharacterized protein (TIGR00369 family)
MSDAELLARVQGRADANLYWQHLGVRVIEAEPGRVRLRLPVRDVLKNAASAPVHGGVYSALVDMAVGAALGTLHEESEGGVGQTTLDLNVSYLSGVRDGDIYAEGRIIRAGRTIAFGDVTVTDSGGQTLAVGRATYMILARRS